MIPVNDTCYGTLAEISENFGLSSGALKYKRWYYKDRFDDDFPTPVGMIAGKDVYEIETIRQWHENHRTRGPQRVIDNGKEEE